MSLLIGALVPPPPWAGKIVGIFGRAISMAHPDGALVSLVSAGSLMEARALCHPPGFSVFREKAEAHFITTGSESLQVAFSADRLAISDFPDDFLDFSGALAWGVRHRDERKISVDSGAASAAAKAIRNLLAQAHRDGKPFEGIHANGVFSAAFRALEGDPVFPANLVGFGPGTTPAGDDWLAGYLAALDLRGGDGAAKAAELRARLPGRLERTTAAGRSLLLGAIEGIPPAYLSDLSGAVSSSAVRPGALADAVSAALHHGATSGEDAIAGFLAGLLVSI